jgi:hypothetical protein
MLVRKVKLCVVVLALRRLRQEDLYFEASLGCIVRLSQKKKKKKEKEKLK